LGDDLESENGVEGGFKIKGGLGRI